MASQVLKINLDKLARILDPVPVATMLFSDSLITQDVWDEAREQGPAYTRNLKVLEALAKLVKVDESAFERFLNHLRTERVYLPVVQELEVQLAQARGQSDAKENNTDVHGAREPLIRRANVDDATLMKIARDVGPKWEEVGVVLGADHTTLMNEIPNETNKGEHMKAFRMLQLCRSRGAEGFTYEKIAAALEDCGLRSTARKYCYE